MKGQQNNHIQKDLTFLTISMFVMVVMWIGFNAYHVSVTSTIVEPQQTTIIPINGRFDQETIKKLKERPLIQPNFENPLVSATASAQPTPAELLFEETLPEEPSPILDVIVEPTEGVTQ